LSALTAHQKQVFSSSLTSGVWSNIHANKCWSV